MAGIDWRFEGVELRQRSEEIFEIKTSATSPS